MSFRIRSTKGLILSEGNQEKQFYTEEEAKDYLSFLELHTTEQWFIIELNDEK